MFRIAFLALSLIGFVSPANAQTAEETVAFLMQEMEDGIVAKGGWGFAGFFRVTQESSSPAVYRLKGQEGEGTLTVRALSECKFELDLTTTDYHMIVDFSKARLGNSVTDGKLDGEYRDSFLCRKDGTKCWNGREAAPFASSGNAGTDEHRAVKAARHLRDKFCPERAF